MTSNPGDGETPSDPYRERPAETSAPSSGATAGQPPEAEPGYWQQQSQYGQPAYGQPYPPYPVAPPNHGGALASMVVGIVGLVLACAYGFGLLASPVAWYLGSKSMKEIDASQGRLGGRGMAQAGKIMGIIGTVLLAILLVVVMVGVILLVATSSSSDF